LYDIDDRYPWAMMDIRMVQRINKWWYRRPRPARSPLDDGLGITIRFAYPDDDPALLRLAALDSRPVPPGACLVAEVDGELWAAVGVTGDRTSIADPFRHTAELVALLHERAQRLAAGPARPRVSRPAVVAVRP
jgi:hypothetical protein